MAFEDIDSYGYYDTDQDIEILYNYQRELDLLHEYIKEQLSHLDDDDLDILKIKPELFEPNSNEDIAALNDNWAENVEIGKQSDDPILRNVIEDMPAKHNYLNEINNKYNHGNYRFNQKTLFA